MSTTWETTTTRHGTQSGFRLHQNLTERPCDACYAAKAEYDRMRKGAPIQAVMNRLHAGAQARATTTEMRRRHLGEWQALYAEAKEELLVERADEITEAKGRS